MHRIDSATSAPSLPTPAAVGSPGFFAAGVPGITPYTQTTNDWGNAVQEEIAAPILAAGISLSKTSNTQLLQAMFALIGKNVQVISSSGIFTVPAHVTALDVELWGAGGGSGGTLNVNSGSGGGAGGGYARKLITGLTPGAVITVTIGAGGAAGNSTPTSGGNGGTTSFGALFSATGGAGGSGANGAVGSNPVIGGNGVSGDINIPGGSTSQPFALAGGIIYAANGGGSHGVPGSMGGWSNISNNGSTGTFPGGGAVGAVGGGVGAAGANGLVIVRW